MTFLPKEEKEPKSRSNYTMPLAEGAHKLRVMSSAIVGYEIWKNEREKKVPVRYKVEDEPIDGKYFWCFVVWNYEQEQLQIMSVTQKSIRVALKAYNDNEKWGSPQDYDIVVTRTGMKLEDTEYTVVANPHTDVDEAIEQTYKNAKISLEDWREGKDPFVKNTKEDSEVMEKNSAF